MSDVPVHVDLDAFARDMRANIAASPKPTTDFERLQLDGGEITVQFGLFLARMDNAGVDMETQMDAGCAIISALIKNLAQDIDAPDDVAIQTVLEIVADYSLRQAEIDIVTKRPEIVGGHA